MGAVVLTSGGQDSTTCLAWAIDKFGKEDIYPVTFDYGQRHQVEIECAYQVCRIFDVRQPYEISLGALRDLSAAALTNPDIEVNADATGTGNVFAEENDLPSTFVPGRNAIFLSFAMAYGAKVGAYDLVTGVCEADAAGYPDCTSHFVYSMEGTLRYALGDRGIRHKINIHAPLLERNKGETFALAARLGVLDTVVKETHTCYNGVHDEEHLHEWGYGCGECPACNERRNGWNEFTQMGEEVHA